MKEEHFVQLKDGTTISFYRRYFENEILNFLFGSDDDWFFEIRENNEVFHKGFKAPEIIPQEINVGFINQKEGSVHINYRKYDEEILTKEEIRKWFLRVFKKKEKKQR